MRSLIGHGAIIAFVAFVLVGLAAGQLLGGPSPEDRTVLALSTALRHPGVAIAIAYTNFPQEKLALAAVMLYLLLGLLLTIPYIKLRRRQHAMIDFEEGPKDEAKGQIPATSNKVPPPARVAIGPE
jgi:BASS family bile acid:Na+ symporter